MDEFERSVWVERSADEVFAFVADLSSVPRYDPHVLRSTALDLRPGVGARYEQLVRPPAGHVRAVVATVVEYEPGRVVGFHSRSGGLEFGGRLRVEPRGGGALLRFSGRLQLHGLARLGGPVIRRALEHHAADNLARIKALLESPSAAAHAGAPSHVAPA